LSFGEERVRKERDWIVWSVEEKVEDGGEDGEEEANGDDDNDGNDDSVDESTILDDIAGAVDDIAAVEVGLIAL
jgi:hypothetical protein